MSTIKVVFNEEVRRVQVAGAISAGGSRFVLVWQDDEGDKVSISSGAEFFEALQVMSYSHAVPKFTVKPASELRVPGGSTAVGTLVIQLAKLKGAWVATTASTRAVEYVSQFGADQIIDYTQTKWWETAESGLSGLDVVFDAAREENLLERAKTEGVVKEGGKIVSVSSHSLGVDAFVNAGSTYKASDLAYVAELLANGTVKLPVENVFPFTEQGAIDIFAKCASGKSLGKQ
eukprot:gene28590-35473_t